MIRRFVFTLIVSVFIFGGCSKQVLVSYPEVEKNNWVTVMLYSGNQVEGHVIQAEPHLLIIRNRQGRNISIEASRIRQVKRIPPCYDDFGNAISEYEIAKEKTNKNATIYGIGGGLLSFGTSFLIGATVVQNSEDAETLLAATTGIGGILGTVLFIGAGKKQDRKEAVERIRESRKSKKIQRKRQKKIMTDEKRREERKKLEEVRRQHEKLLRELEETKKQD